MDKIGNEGVRLMCGVLDSRDKRRKCAEAVRACGKNGKNERGEPKLRIISGGVKQTQGARTERRAR